MVHNKRIFENLMYNGQLHAENFAEINYDHWMNNIWGTIVQLFTFLNVQLSTETVKKIQVIFISNIRKVIACVGHHRLHPPKS